MSQFMVTPKKPNLPPTPMSYCKTSLPPLSAILKKDSVPMTPSAIASVARLPSIDSFTTPSHEKVRYISPSLPSAGAPVTSIFPTPMIHKHHSAPQLSVITTPSKTGENNNNSFSSVNTSESDITPNESLAQSKSNSPVESKAYAFISHSPATFPNQEPSIDNAPLARRKRRRTSPNELSILNKEFEVGSTPNKARRIEISKKVQMTEKAVQIWFQNKRQALRKHSTSEKEVTELPLVSEPAIISSSTPIKPQLNKSHSFVSPSHHHITESPMQKRSFSTGALHLYNKDNNGSHNESDISDDSINTSTLIFAKGFKVKDEEISNLVLNKTKKKQPNFLNSGSSSTMTFKLAPAKSKSPRKEERKPLGDININTMQARVGVKLEHAKKENENECVQNLLALRAANWS